MRKLLYFVFVWFFSLSAICQESSFEKQAQKVLDDIMCYRGDTVYSQMSANMKAAVTPLQLNTLWYTFSLQGGDLKSISNWKHISSMGYDIVTARIDMEKLSLDYQVVFSESEISGLFFKKSEVESSIDSSVNDNLIEKDMELSCDGYRMPAKLTLPKGVDNPPCVIIVHGSGPSDMNGFKNIYKTLSRKLAEKGIASFRYDKRTFVYKTLLDSIAEKITVDYETTDDALAAVKLLLSCDGIDHNSLFIIGHSQGGMMIPRIAQRTDDVRGYVMLSAPARKFVEIFVEQMEYLYSIGMNPSWPEIKPDLEKQIDNLRLYGTDKYNSEIVPPLNLPLAYAIDFENYNQLEEGNKISVPLLVLNGEGDYQVTMTDFNLWKKTFEGMQNVRFISYPGLGHLYTPSSNPPSPADYEKGGEFSDKVIDDIVEWINEVTIGC